MFIRRIALASALLAAGPAFAAGTDHLASLEWSPVTQEFTYGAMCSGRNTITSYDGRWDLTRPAYGSHPAVTQVINPEDPFQPGYGYDDTDPTDMINISLNMDKRFLAFTELMGLHQACAQGGNQAKGSCIPFKRVESVMDILFKNSNTGADFTPDTYTAPRAQFSQGTGLVWKFTQARHLYNYIVGGSATLRQSRFRSLSDGYANDKWSTYNTPGSRVVCTECRDSYVGGYNPGKATDTDVFSPAQVAAAEAVLLAPLEEDEYVLDENGKVFVPFCPEAE